MPVITQAREVEEPPHLPDRQGNGGHPKAWGSAYPVPS